MKIKADLVCLLQGRFGKDYACCQLAAGLSKVQHVFSHHEVAYPANIIELMVQIMLADGEVINGYIR